MGWFPKLRNTRLRMITTGIVSKPKMVLKITATVLNLPLTPMKSRTRFQQMTRQHLKLRSRTPSNGLTLTQREKKKNTKRNKRSSKVLLCRFFKRWPVVLVACQEACLVDPCRTWAVLPEVLLLLLNRRVAPLLKKSIKRKHFFGDLLFV